jgi:hypothetical protein
VVLKTFNHLITAALIVQAAELQLDKTLCNKPDMSGVSELA